MPFVLCICDQCLDSLLRLCLVWMLTLSILKAHLLLTVLPPKSHNHLLDYSTFNILLILGAQTLRTIPLAWQRMAYHSPAAFTSPSSSSSGITMKSTCTVTFLCATQRQTPAKWWVNQEKQSKSESVLLCVWVLMYQWTVCAELST